MSKQDIKWYASVKEMPRVKGFESLKRTWEGLV